LYNRRKHLPRGFAIVEGIEGQNVVFDRPLEDGLGIRHTAAN
jgi:hypothetical protein